MPDLCFDKLHELRTKLQDPPSFAHRTLKSVGNDLVDHP